MTMEPIFQIGKGSISPSLVAAISEALEARELIKISVLKNCADAVSYTHLDVYKRQALICFLL